MPNNPREFYEWFMEERKSEGILVTPWENLEPRGQLSWGRFYRRIMKNVASNN